MDLHACPFKDLVFSLGEQRIFNTVRKSRIFSIEVYETPGVWTGFFLSASFALPPQLIGMLKDIFQNILYKISQPLVSLIIALRISPNGLTVMGLLANAAAAWVMIQGSREGLPGAYSALLWGGALILLGGFFDILDGRVARLSGKASPAGALFDSVLDRYAELLMFLGIAWMAWQIQQPRSMLAAYAAMGFSVMVSYTRARNEGLGQQGGIGLFQRPERIVLISLAAMITGFWGPSGFWSQPDAAWKWIMEPTLWVISAGAFFTAIQRLHSGYQGLRRNPPGN